VLTFWLKSERQAEHDVPEPVSTGIFFGDMFRSFFVEAGGFLCKL
jgi:hypothetical protein